MGLFGFPRIRKSSTRGVGRLQV